MKIIIDKENILNYIALINLLDFIENSFRLQRLLSRGETFKGLS